MIETLYQEGLPDRKKQKKTKEDNVDMQETDAGAEIFIPKTRKRKTILPKSFNPELPGNLPDPERWLPKWQRSKYKRRARKMAKYMKGGAVQGDAQIDTDVTKFATGGMAAQSTAHVSANTSKK